MGTIREMVEKDHAEFQEQQREASAVAAKSKMDSIYQKNLSINQLKEENRKLIAKVGQTRTRKA